ncbi:hypothetical protein [Azospirillum argentinense]
MNQFRQFPTFETVLLFFGRAGRLFAAEEQRNVPHAACWVLVVEMKLKIDETASRGVFDAMRRTIHWLFEDRERDSRWNQGSPGIDFQPLPGALA